MAHLVGMTVRRLAWLLLLAAASCRNSDGNLVYMESEVATRVVGDAVVLSESHRPDLQAAQRAGWRMLRAAAGDGATNFALSPLGMTMSAALMANGLDGPSREPFERACGIVPGKPKPYNQAMAAALTAIETDPDKPACYANAVWMVWPLPVRQDYQYAVEQPYRAKVLNLGSAGRESVLQVNAWCKRQTDGRIPELVERLDPKAAVLVTNAVEVRYEWAEPFEPAKPAPFQGAQGRREVPTLSSTRKFLLAEADGVRAAWLPTRSGYVAFLLPPEGEGWPGLARRLETGLLERLRGRRAERSARITFPEHSVDARTDLMPALQSLVGEKAIANLDMRFVSHELIAGQFVLASQQRVQFKLDESGAGREAATQPNAEAGSSGPADAFVADRPFLVVVEAPGSNLVLLAAWVADPGA